MPKKTATQQISRVSRPRLYEQLVEQLMEFIESAQLGPGDTLTVWKLDRLGRSVSELLDIIKGLEARGIAFRCLTQPIDTSTPAGKMFLTFLAAFAEFERELMRERVIAGKQRMITDGEHPGGVPMYGFAADHVTIIEE